MKILHCTHHYAVLDLATGRVFGRFRDRAAAQRFIDGLRQ